MFHRPIILALALFGSSAVLGGEIIFVDPAREKAGNLPPPPDARARTQQSVERAMDSARHQVGRGAPGETVLIVDDPQHDRPPASTRKAMEAREYLDDEERSPPVQVQRTDAMPPSEAARARQAARAWTSSNADTSERCRTENTVGAIEGTPQGRTVVIQNSKGSVTVCK